MTFSRVSPWLGVQREILKSPEDPDHWAGLNADSGSLDKIHLGEFRRPGFSDHHPVSQKPDSVSPPFKHRWSCLPRLPDVDKSQVLKRSVNDTDQPDFELASHRLLTTEELFDLIEPWVSYLRYREKAPLSFHDRLSGLSGM